MKTISVPPRFWNAYAIHWADNNRLLFTADGFLGLRGLGPDDPIEAVFGQLE